MNTSEPIKCECPEKGVLRPGFASWYNENERPYVDHEPHQCKCTNGIKLYRRKDGTEKYLCSCCNLSSDTLVNENEKAHAE